MQEGINDHFSVTEIAGIFQQIDARILQLHECSKEDFSLLTRDFKLFYKQSKELESNANSLFSLVSGTESSILLQQLNSFYQQLETNQKILGQFSRDTLSTFESILTMLDGLFFPLRNLSQNLMTVKFLIANQQLNSMCENSIVDLTSTESTNVSRVFSDIKQACITSARLIANYKQELAKADSLFEDGTNAQLEAVDEILEKVHTSIILYGEKYEGAQGMLNQLSRKTEDTTSSIAEIITKLQFQDIIRQKMEHIQASHRGIMEELNAISNNQLHENGDSIYGKIKDIASLQAAQLIHANKEHQGAIESITENFITIGDTLTDISSMCRNFTLETTETEETHFLLLTKKLEKSSSVIHESIAFTERLVAQVKTLESIVLELLPIISNLPDLMTILRSKLIGSGRDTASNQKTTTQIKELVSGIDSYNQNVVTSHANISVKVLELDQIISRVQLGRSIDGSFLQLASDLKLIVQQLKLKSKEVYSLLERNQKLGNEVKTNIKKSIHEVKYYDFFETAIIEITGELNEISKKVATSRDSTSFTAEHLRNIKKSYTMDSEHKIHDKIVSQEMSNEDIDTETDNSEVEFF